MWNCSSISCNQKQLSKVIYTCRLGNQSHAFFICKTCFIFYLYAFVFSLQVALTRIVGMQQGHYNNNFLFTAKVIKAVRWTYKNHFALQFQQVAGILLTPFSRPIVKNKAFQINIDVEHSISKNDKQKIKSMLLKKKKKN